MFSVKPDGEMVCSVICWCYRQNFDVSPCCLGVTCTSHIDRHIAECICGSDAIGG